MLIHLLVELSGPQSLISGLPFVLVGEVIQLVESNLV